MENNSIINSSEQNEDQPIKTSVDVESEKFTTGESVKEVLSAEQDNASPGKMQSLSNDEFKKNSIYLAIDKDIWLYMTSTQKYSLALDKVKTNCNIKFDLAVDKDGHLCLIGSSIPELEKAHVETERLIEHCCQTVRTVILPHQELDVYNNIEELIKSNHRPNAIVTVANEIIKVTGTDTEIENCIGMLEETLGLKTSSNGNLLTSSLEDPIDHLPQDVGLLQESIGVTNEEMQRDSIPLTNPILQLWRQDDLLDLVNENDKELYGEVVEIDEQRWLYMQKNCHYSNSIKQIKNDMNLMVEERVTEGPQDNTYVCLVFTGTNDDVLRAVKKAQEVTGDCKSLSKTITVPCTDNKIFSKICKHLKSINKSSCYVSTSLDTVFITGNDDERADCLERLQKLGLFYEFLQNKESEGEEEHESEDVSTVVEEHVQREDKVANFKQIDMLLEQEDHNAPKDAVKRARQNEEAAERARQNEAVTDESEDIGQDASEDKSGKHFAELPVPIEEQLWLYIEERRRDQLRDLRETFQMTIASYPGYAGYVTITLEADSDVMLDCGRDALVQLLEQLRTTVISVTIDTNSQELPNELKDLLKQMSNGTDAVVHCSGGHIYIIGPGEDTTTCQQKIAAFMQQVAAQAGQTIDPALQNQLDHRESRLGNQGFHQSNMQAIVRSRQEHLTFPTDGGHGMTTGVPHDQYDVLNASAVGRRLFTDGTDLSHGPNKNPMISGIFPPVNDGPSMLDDENDDEKSEEKTRGSQLWSCSSNKDNKGHLSPEFHGSMEDKEKNTEQHSSFLREKKETPRVSGDKYASGRSIQEDVHSVSKVIKTESKKSALNFPKNHARLSDVKEEHTKVNSEDHLPDGQTIQKKSDIYTHNEMCSVCQIAPYENAKERKCNHSFCVSCVQTYFTSNETQCPVCGINESLKDLPTQPENGQMLVTYDNSFKLPGFPTSRGTIIVVYLFPAGVQMGDMPTPGKAYSGLTQTTFFPLSSEGSKVVNLLQCAFDQKRVFTIKTKVDSHVDEITWNGILHKTNAYGGPQLHGYPDPVYLSRVTSELEAVGFV